MEQQSGKIKKRKFSQNKVVTSEKHKELAAFIKNTHNRLREESRIYGANEAWSRHLSKTKELQVSNNNY